MAIDPPPSALARSRPQTTPQTEEQVRATVRQQTTHSDPFATTTVISCINPVGRMEDEAQAQESGGRDGEGAFLLCNGAERTALEDGGKGQEEEEQSSPSSSDEAAEAAAAAATTTTSPTMTHLGSKRPETLERAATSEVEATMMNFRTQKEDSPYPFAFTVPPAVSTTTSTPTATSTPFGLTTVTAPSSSSLENQQGLHQHQRHDQREQQGTQCPTAQGWTTTSATPTMGSNMNSNFSTWPLPLAPTQQQEAGDQHHLFGEEQRSAWTDPDVTRSSVGDGDGAYRNGVSGRVVGSDGVGVGRGYGTRENNARTSQMDTKVDTEMRQEGNPSSRPLYTDSPVSYHHPLQTQHTHHPQRYHQPPLHGTGPNMPSYPSSYHHPSPGCSSVYPFPSHAPRTALGAYHPIGTQNSIGWGDVNGGARENDDDGGGGFMMIPSYKHIPNTTARDQLHLRNSSRSVDGTFYPHWHQHQHHQHQHQHQHQQQQDRQRTFSGYNFHPHFAQHHEGRETNGEEVFFAPQQPAQRQQMKELTGNNGTSSNVNGTPVFFTPSTNTYTTFLPPGGELSYPPTMANTTTANGHPQRASNNFLNRAPRGVLSPTSGGSGNAADDDLDMSGGIFVPPTPPTARGSGGGGGNEEETIFGRIGDRHRFQSSPRPPKRGRRRGESKPGPNFLTKLYA
ncbi:hypothetical protein QFC19_000415 [Naganishia cerealis]|uniref:Uncharacterized protein n=1 Tax=Naganishia cerealis TaxID=610337 RepID=A0ACC2WNW5_9TREE|nr:hypothetical protein QFC19_000415 [Naganishia cerealis]